MAASMLRTCARQPLTRLGSAPHNAVRGAWLRAASTSTGSAAAGSATATVTSSTSSTLAPGGPVSAYAPRDGTPLPGAGAAAGGYSIPIPPPTVGGPGGPSGVTQHLNPGTELDLGWVQRAVVNRSAVERRAAEIGPRRAVKKRNQVAWLLRAISMIDLTTLAGDDTPGNVQRLCAKAKNPVRTDILEMLGAEKLGLTCGAVCVYPSLVKSAVKALEGTGIPVASVATGFPSGQVPLPQKLDEIRAAVEDGAREIDIVISRTMALTGDWEGVYREVCQFKEACGPAHMKTILATGELPTYKHVYQASLACMMAGADFIKTSTGKEPTNATVAVSLVMLRAIREFYERTGYRVGFKPAGGINSAKQVLVYQAMLKDELGPEWVNNTFFRFGASRLLTDIERQLYHGATNEYAAGYYMPMA